MWVNEHYGVRTTRAKKLCRAYGAEKMSAALSKLLLRSVRHRFQTWKDYYLFLLDQVRSLSAGLTKAVL